MDIVIAVQQVWMIKFMKLFLKKNFMQEQVFKNKSFIDTSFFFMDLSTIFQPIKSHLRGAEFSNAVVLGASLINERIFV